MGGRSEQFKNWSSQLLEINITDLICMVIIKGIIKPVLQCSHTHSPYCLILQPNLPQCLSCCTLRPINRVGGRGAGGQAKRAIG